MANEIVSPNMQMSVPVPSTCPGPQWAQDIYSCLYTNVDQHNHSSGQGVKIQPSGLNINSDLSFNANSAIALKTTTYQDQGSSLSSLFLGALYVAGGNLYFNAGNDGFAVQITSGHSVNGSSGTITGLPSGTASASFAGSTFTFQSATSTAANIDGASIIIRDTTASSNGITLSAPPALASNYGLILPAALPGSQSFLSLDASGNIASYASVSGGITATNLAANAVTTDKIADGAVTTAKIADAAVTPAKIAASNTGSVSFTSSVSTGTLVAVSGSAISFTSNGRPLLLTIQGRTNISNPGFIKCTTTGPFNTIANLTIRRDASTGSQLDITTFQVGPNNAQTIPGDYYYSLGLVVLDIPTAGVHTYELLLQQILGGGGKSATISDGIFTITEIF